MIDWQHVTFPLARFSGRKGLEQRTYQDDERIATLEQQLAEAQLIAEDSDRKYDEVISSSSSPGNDYDHPCHPSRLPVVLPSWKSIWNVPKIVPKLQKRKIIAKVVQRETIDSTI